MITLDPMTFDGRLAKTDLSKNSLDTISESASQPPPTEVVAVSIALGATRTIAINKVAVIPDSHSVCVEYLRPFLTRVSPPKNNYLIINQ